MNILTIKLKLKLTNKHIKCFYQLFKWLINYLEYSVKDAFTGNPDL
ncbi:hypothetical protein J2127_000313 [Methanococcus voltae]|nr:hypothetical protein [Methanococcus voltae]